MQAQLPSPATTPITAAIGKLSPLALLALLELVSALQRLVEALYVLQKQNSVLVEMPLTS